MAAASENEMSLSSSNSSSSGEEDGNSERRDAIDSVASTTAFDRFSATKPTSKSSRHPSSKSQNTKYYQLKAQQLLDDMLEKTIEVVSGANQLPDEDSHVYEGGVQLFKHAPCSIVFDHVEEFQRPKKKARLLPGEDIDENSKVTLCLANHLNAEAICSGPPCSHVEDAGCVADGKMALELSSKKSRNVIIIGMQLSKIFPAARCKQQNPLTQTHSWNCKYENFPAGSFFKFWIEPI